MRSQHDETIHHHHSLTESIQTPCPQCGQLVDLDIWLIVDTAERPDLAGRILDGTLHEAPCPHCGYVGHVDAPLLLYCPDASPTLLFSPAQQTSADQDREQAAGLVQHLQDSLGDDWRDEWLTNGLPDVPRALLPIALSDNPAAALQQMAGQAQQAADNIEIPAEIENTPSQTLADSLAAWVQQETLDKAEAYLRQHQAELLTDEAAAVMQRLVQANPHNPNLPDHQARLARARESGIAAMYAELRRQRLAAVFEQALQQVGPLGLAVSRFALATDDDAAGVLLQTETHLLLTLDAGDLLRQLTEAADAAGDEAAVARLRTRHQQWQAAYQARVGGALRRTPAEPGWQLGAQPESWADRAERQPVQAERGSTYTVVRASQCAIGDYALVINNIGLLPLRWQRPAEGRPRLAHAAVGREADLDELCRRLTAGQGAAVVGRGTSAALRGQPAIGKTTLAAMYANRYGDRYPGGMLWLEVGPDRRSADSAVPILQRIAAYAYAADAQAQALLGNAAFAPDVVRMLLHGHGAMLVVIDDVWDPAVLRALQDSLPDEAVVLLTTRDYHVAYALAGSEAAIQSLGVLSPADACALLQKSAPGLSDELANRVAAGLGCHALALTLAAGALAFRKAHRYERTAAELLDRVAAGLGFGDLPRMDQAERLTEIEIAFKYSYDELGQGARGAEQQAWFRALGAYAQEADFDVDAAAAVWGLDTGTTQEFLLCLDGLSLIQEAGMANRWQQHALLRAYALSLQTAEERIRFAERHTDHYIKLTEVCHDCKPRDYDRVEREFAQIQHAFAWCEGNSPRRATRLALLLADFMRNRGRVPQLNCWLQTALSGAETLGDRLGKANTLKSLGDLERRLGNIDQARRHYDAALPLYEAEQDRLGKANTLKSLGDLESRLGNIDQARRHYDAALPLYEAEQDPVGKMNTWIGLARLEAGLGHMPEAERDYQQVFSMAEQLGFGDHPVTRDLRQEYERFKAAQSPLAQALAALFQVDGLEALEQTLTQHPVLLDPPALEQLAALVTAAYQASQPDTARHVLARLAILLERYNHAHAEQVDLAEQARFVALHEALLPVAEALDIDWAAGLRRSLGWALNTLGNAHAEQGDHAAAIETYSRAIGQTPDNAMLYRNRAGEYLELQQWTQAEADIAQAATLEPEASRLAQLHQALAQRSRE